MIIRRAKKTDFPFVYPILKQIFDEMQMKSIESLPEDQFYSLMKLGFISEDYRYSYLKFRSPYHDLQLPKFGGMNSDNPRK